MQNTTSASNGDGTRPQGSRRLRVVVADDHTMFREMLLIALPRAGDLEIVGEAADGREVEAVVDRARPDVVLLDYRMPQVRNFTSLVREIRSRHPRVQVVVLSGLCSEEVAASAGDGGARGYVLKSARLSAVAAAVRTVGAGGVWIDPALPPAVFETFRCHAGRATGITGALGRLTRRELEVLAAVAGGMSNHQIAKRLFISDQTVKTHLTRIFAKLQVRNRLAAALAFYEKPLGVGPVSEIAAPLDSPPQTARRTRRESKDEAPKRVLH